MGWTFLPIESLPDPGDIVWCKFPVRERPGAPGPIVRAVLVRESLTHEEPSGLRFGSVVVSYGTGEFDAGHDGLDLIIRDWERVKVIGLHKPTRFALDEGSKKNLIWCTEFFLPPKYVANRGIRVGSLSDEEFEAARACLKRRGILSD